jgi:hypothetical protein
MVAGPIVLRRVGVGVASPDPPPQAARASKQRRAAATGTVALLFLSTPMIRELA